MSDIQLKSEIESIIKMSGYSKSNKLLCSVIRIVTMRHKEVPRKQLLKVSKSVF